MTGLYKTPEQRTFFNYYALMPLSNDPYATEHRWLLCLEAFALTFVTLGAYPLLLGLFMCGEYLLAGRVTQNIDSLADTIDRVIASSQKSLNPKNSPNIDDLANTIDQNLPTDVQNLIMSQTGADLNQLKLASRALQTKAESALALAYGRDLDTLKKNLINNDEVREEINSKFKPNIEKSLVFKTTDELTTFLVDKLTKEEIDQLEALPGFSSDFKDLLHVNLRLKNLRETKVLYQKDVDEFTNIIQFLCEKEMFNKAIDVAVNTMKSRNDSPRFYKLLEINHLRIISQESIKKNRLATALKATGYFEKYLIADNLGDISFKELIEKLCSANEFGKALKIIDQQGYKTIQNVFPIFLSKLCDKGLFEEAKIATDLMVVSINKSKHEGTTWFLNDAYMTIAAKLCEQKRISEVLDLQQEYATKESMPYPQSKLLVWIIQNLAKNHEFKAAEDLINTIPKPSRENNYDENRKDALQALHTVYQNCGMKGDVERISLEIQSVEDLIPKYSLNPSNSPIETWLSSKEKKRNEMMSPFNEKRQNKGKNR